jgi:hypothetical protein
LVLHLLRKKLKPVINPNPVPAIRPGTIPTGERTITPIDAPTNVIVATFLIDRFDFRLKEEVATEISLSVCSTVLRMESNWTP